MKLFAYGLISLIVVLPVAIEVIKNKDDADGISAVYDGVKLAIKVIGPVLGGLALLFLGIFWNKPVIVLSQRWVLVAIVITQIVYTIGDGYLDNSTLVGCYMDALLWFGASNCLYALLTIKQWRIHELYQIIRLKEKGRRVMTVRPWIYVAVVTILSLCVMAGFALLPYSVEGFNLCNPGVDNVRDYIVARGHLGLAPDFFFTINHLIMFTMACIGRNYPSVIGDSVALFVLGFVGLFWIVVDLISSLKPSSSYSNPNSPMILYIFAYVVMLLVMVLTFVSIIFERGFYLHYTKQEVVSKFLGIDFEFYDSKVNGATPPTSWGPETIEGEGVIEVKQARNVGPDANRVSWPTLKAMVDGEPLPGSRSENSLH